MTIAQYQALKQLQEETFKKALSIYTGRLFVEFTVHDVDVNAEVWQFEKKHINTSKSKPQYYTNAHFERVSLFSKAINPENTQSK